MLQALDTLAPFGILIMKKLKNVLYVLQIYKVSVQTLVRHEKKEEKKKSSYQKF